MKRILSVLLALSMIMSMGIMALAEGEATENIKPEYLRPNNSSDVYEYFSADESKKWARYEVERGEMIEGARINSDHKVYTKQQQVALTYMSKGLKIPGVKLTVKSYITGVQDMYIAYDNGHGFAQSTNLTVNGVTQKVYYPTVQENVWNKWGMIKVSVDLKAGDNEVIISYDDADCPSSFNIDFIAISKGDEWRNEANSVVLTIGKNTIIKNTENGQIPVQTDVAPIIKDGRTFIPVRGVFELLGATVLWNGETKEATIRTTEAEVVIKIGYIAAQVEGKPAYMDVPAFIQGGRTLIPVRFVSENLGYKVEWNPKTQEILVDKAQ